MKKISRITTLSLEGPSRDENTTKTFSLFLMSSLSSKYAFNSHDYVFNLFQIKLKKEEKSHGKETAHFDTSEWRSQGFC